MGQVQNKIFSEPEMPFPFCSRVLKNVPLELSQTIISRFTTLCYNSLLVLVHGALHTAMLRAKHSFCIPSVPAWGAERLPLSFVGQQKPPRLWEHIWELRSVLGCGWVLLQLRSELRIVVWDEMVRKVENLSTHKLCS